MELCKGQIKIGKKKVKRGTIRFFFHRYLKKNHKFHVCEFNDKHKFEILTPVKIDDLDFFVDIDFSGIKPKEIELRSIDELEYEGIRKYNDWAREKLGVDLSSNQWKTRSFRWGTISAKLTKLHKDDNGCITVKLKYK